MRRAVVFSFLILIGVGTAGASTPTQLESIKIFAGSEGELLQSSNPKKISKEKIKDNKKKIEYIGKKIEESRESSANIQKSFPSFKPITAIHFEKEKEPNHPFFSFVHTLTLSLLQSSF